MAASAAFIDGYMQAIGVVQRGRLAFPLSNAAYAKAKRTCDQFVQDFGDRWQQYGMSDTQAGYCFGCARRGLVGSFRWVIDDQNTRLLDLQIAEQYRDVRMRKNAKGTWDFLSKNPAKYGSVEQFVTNRGMREFSIGNVEAAVGGTKGMLTLELGRLVAQGKVRKTSKVGGVQFYMSVPTEQQAPKPAYVSPTWQPTQRTPEQEAALDLQTRHLATLGSIPEVQAMRAHSAVARAKDAVNKAMAAKRAADAKAAAAQSARNRGLLMQAEGEQEAASAMLARAKRNLVDAELHLRRMDPTGEHAPEKNPRKRKRRKR